MIMAFWIVMNLTLLAAFWGNFYRRKDNLYADLYLSKALLLFSVVIAIWSIISLVSIIWKPILLI